MYISYKPKPGKRKLFTVEADGKFVGEIKLGRDRGFTPRSTRVRLSPSLLDSISRMIYDRA